MILCYVLFFSFLAWSFDPNSAVLITVVAVVDDVLFHRTNFFIQFIQADGAAMMPARGEKGREKPNELNHCKTMLRKHDRHRTFWTAWSVRDAHPNWIRFSWFEISSKNDVFYPVFCIFTQNWLMITSAIFWGKKEQKSARMRGESQNVL